MLSLKKPYKFGILVGRFQTLHKGHEDMINAALSVCEKVGVFVGSSQECGTNKNPFSYDTRKEMLNRVFGDKIDVFPLPDIGVGNVPEWGDYVIKNVVDAVGYPPDLFISGKEERRATWLAGKSGEKTAELYIPKTIDISASKLREYMIQDDIDNWKKYSNESLFDMFGDLRKQLITAKDNTKTSSI